MTEDERLARINELARRQKEGTLTPEEQEEQAKLRQEFLADFRASLRDQLDHTWIVTPDGQKHPFGKRQG